MVAMEAMVAMAIKTVLEVAMAATFKVAVPVLLAEVTVMKV